MTKRKITKVNKFSKIKQVADDKLEIGVFQYKDKIIKVECVGKTVNERVANLYARRRKNKICVICGKNKPKKDYVNCPSCIEKTKKTKAKNKKLKVKKVKKVRKKKVVKKKVSKR